MRVPEFSRAFVTAILSARALVLPITFTGYAALSVERHTTASTPASTAASSTFAVPTAFVRRAALGSFSHPGMSFIAAAWNTKSTPFMALRQSSALRISPATKLNLGVPSLYLPACGFLEKMRISPMSVPIKRSTAAVPKLPEPPVMSRVLPENTLILLIIKRVKPIGPVGYSFAADNLYDFAAEVCENGFSGGCTAK